VNLEEFAEQEVEAQHMGKISPRANVQIERITFKKIRISWDAIYHGHVVRQYAEFNDTSIYLGECPEDCKKCEELR
jgi:hypothetical protein